MPYGDNKGAPQPVDLKVHALYKLLCPEILRAIFSFLSLYLFCQTLLLVIKVHSRHVNEFRGLEAILQTFYMLDAIVHEIYPGRKC